MKRCILVLSVIVSGAFGNSACGGKCSKYVELEVECSDSSEDERVLRAVVEGFCMAALEDPTQNDLLHNQTMKEIACAESNKYCSKYKECVAAE
jgi:hypothetical protein